MSNSCFIVAYGTAVPFGVVINSAQQQRVAARRSAANTGSVLIVLEVLVAVVQSI